MNWTHLSSETNITP